MLPCATVLNSNAKRPATTADRVLGLMSLFDGERAEWTVEEAASELKLPITTTYRYFRTLANAGFIMALVTGRYALGPAVMYFDRQMRLHDPLIRIAQPLLGRLAASLQQPATVALCRLYRGQVICFHHESAAQPSIGYERGILLPLSRGAASKVILAALPGGAARRAYEEHAAALARHGFGNDWPDARGKLRGLRERGFCVTHSEIAPGVTDIAVPIPFNPRKQAIGALCAAVRGEHLSGPVLERMVAQLAASAKRILKESTEAIRRDQRELEPAGKRARRASGGVPKLRKSRA